MSTHKSLLSRLHTRLRIEPVTPEDSADYLRHRLKLARGDRELFAQDCLALLHEASQGTHRELDRLASLCLREAARRKHKLIDTELVRVIVARQAHSAGQRHARGEPVLSRGPARLLPTSSISGLGAPPPAASPSTSPLATPSTSLLGNTEEEWRMEEESINQAGSAEL